MKVFNGIESFKGVDKPIITTGTFDGVHLGHKVIINRLVEVAKNCGGESVLLTFFPHPRMILNPDNSDLKLINTIDERVELLAKTGLDNLIIHPFSLAFSRLSSLEFVRNILVDKLKVHQLVIGYDHHFGKNREGTFEHLKEYAPLYGFEVQEIPAIEVQDVNVSSTKIRKALLKGEVVVANKFLGYPFFLRGKVIRGNQYGRKIDFPTANIKIEEDYKLIPQNGVYAVKVYLGDEKYNGMLNIGFKPTISVGEKSIEVHILGFNRDIYNKPIRIEFYNRIRDEQKFGNLEQLRQQLKIDKTNILEILD